MLTVADCTTYHPGYPKRQRCIDCVSRGARFHNQGGGFGYCEGAPPPPVKPEWMQTTGDCAAHIHNPGKRQRCFACIASGGQFSRHGHGSCSAPTAVVTPPPPPPPVVEILRNPGECMARLGYPPKRHQCMACVNRGGQFNTQGAGAGFCSMPAPPPPPPPPVVEILRNPGECMARLGYPPKRHQCMACVNRGGQFNTQGAGAGFCSMPAPPPPPPPPPSGVEIMTIQDCFARIGHPGTRNHCRKCVQRGGRWDLRGFCR
jgi:hypothetical protein